MTMHAYDFMLICVFIITVQLMYCIKDNNVTGSTSGGCLRSTQRPVSNLLG